MTKQKKQEIRVCKQCNKEFIHTSENRKYCSDLCRKNARYQLSLKYKPNINKKVKCKQCNKSFLYSFKFRVFCSISCKELYNKRYNRESCKLYYERNKNKMYTYVKNRYQKLLESKMYGKYNYFEFYELCLSLLKKMCSNNQYLSKEIIKREILKITEVNINKFFVLVAKIGFNNNLFEKYTNYSYKSKIFKEG